MRSLFLVRERRLVCDEYLWKDARLIPASPMKHMPTVRRLCTELECSASAIRPESEETPSRPDLYAIPWFIQKFRDAQH